MVTPVTDQVILGKNKQEEEEEKKRKEALLKPTPQTPQATPQPKKEPVAQEPHPDEISNPNEPKFEEQKASGETVQYDPEIYKDKNVQKAMAKSTEATAQAQQAHREYVIGALEYKHHLDTLHEQQQRRTEEYHTVLKAKEREIMSAAPIRYSVINSGSLGQSLLSLAFAVGTPTYLKSLKEAYQREIITRNTALAEYKEIGNMWKSSQKAEAAFIADGLAVIKKVKESKLRTITDPLEIERQQADIEKINQSIELAKENQTIAERRVAATEASNALKRETLEHNKEMDYKELDYKNKVFNASQQQMGVGVAATQAQARLNDPMGTGKSGYSYGVTGKQRDKVVEKSAGYRNYRILSNRLLKDLNWMQTQNLSSLTQRGAYAIKGAADAIGYKSAKYNRLVKFHNQLLDLVKTGKDALGLGRLSDKDFDIIKEYIGFRVGGVWNTSWATPSKLAKLKGALIRIQNREAREIIRLGNISDKTGRLANYKQYMHDIDEDIRKEESVEIERPAAMRQGAPQRPSMSDSYKKTYRGDQEAALLKSVKGRR